MTTRKQSLGSFGEVLVAKSCDCPRCKKQKSLKRLTPNFKCADLVCDFCGYLAQVKTSTVIDITCIPDQILGAAWAPQKERMDAGIYFPLFLVLKNKKKSASAVYYLCSDLQKPSIFKPRKPLSVTARRAGWQGFLYDLREIKNSFVRLK